jgi:hypothetical protein
LSLLKRLREWWQRIALAMWLHPEFDITKRHTIFGAAAMVATALMPAPIVRAFGRIQLADVTRRAFMPRVYVQLWKAAPLMAALLVQ